jgi:tetratricopeptide (TPR) repeat protein
VLVKRIFSYKLVGFAIVCMFLLQSQVSVAQWTLDVMGSVKKDETNKRMEGATLTIKRNGSVWKTITSESNGKFLASLPPDAIYMIEFSKPGHVTKRIELSTKNVPPEDAKYGFDFPMEMNLFEKMDGLDVSILDKPIGKVAFDPATGYMNFNEAYTKSIKKELDRLKVQLAERLKSEEEKRKANQKSYDAAVADADKAYNAGNWAEAKPFYEKALSIFPKETYPDFQLADISAKLAELEAANKNYNVSIEKADKAFAEREWDKAITNYESASLLKEQEEYPKNKIKEINTIQADEKKVTIEYNEAIALADQYFLNKEFEKAKTDYQKASALKSYEEYPKGKLKEIESVLAELAKKDKEYNDAIAEADKQFTSKEYENSIETYNKALTFKPDESYPKNKIDEASRLVAEMKLIQENYDKFIADAEIAFNDKNYDLAKSNYDGALKLKEDEQYPTEKLLEIQTLIDAAAKLEVDYANEIKKGDVAFDSKEYETAKTAYEAALVLKTEEQYPKGKVIEIEALLVELAKKEAEEKAIEEEYQGLITAADGLLNEKNYEGAKGKYTEALGVKSEEQYPKDKITEIDVLLAELAKKEAEDKAKEEQYKELITAADGLLNEKSYEDAKEEYTRALEVKSEEQYPKDKITEIDGLLAELEKEKAKEEQYQGLISAADGFLNEKNYESAKEKYTEALGLKLEEQYPKDKITEIDVLLANLAKLEAEKEAKEKAEQELQAKYDALIASADKLFSEKGYEGAKGKYTEAIDVKSEEQYPKDKVTEIDGLLADIARKKDEADAAKLAEAERDAKYQEVITLADNALEYKNYDQAKLKYNEALGIKNGEQYPKDKLKEIEDILAAIAKQKEEDVLASESERKKKEYFDALIAEADAELLSKNYTGAEEKYNQALGVVPGEKYPQDKLQEIKDILAKIETKKNNDVLAKQELDKKYNDLIIKADQYFGEKRYAAAKSSYQRALSVKPEEFYPKDQIKEIERLLKEIADKESEISLTNNALKQKQEQYNAYVKTADADFLGKRYEKSISNYEQAIGIMPDKTYPKEKIDEINLLLTAIAEKNKNENAAAKADRERRENYDKLIYDADRALNLKEYTKAQVTFKEALNLYTEEQYPKDKLLEILELLKKQEEPKEVIVSNNTYSGNRAKINNEKEKEIEERMAKLLNKAIIEKNKDLQKDKVDYENQEEIRISGGIDRTKEAEGELDQYADDIAAQTERGNKFHIENNKSIVATTALLEKAENERIKDADKRRETSDEEFAEYLTEELAFKNKQDKLSKDKMENHDIYVDNVTEAKLVMIERGGKAREENRKDTKLLIDETEKNKAISKKRREDLELDVHEYRAELANDEKIMVSASIDRTDKNEKDLKKLANEMTEMNVEKTNYYKLNVDGLVKFKERIDELESLRMVKAEKSREINKKEKEKIEADFIKNTERQQKRYYDDIGEVNEFKKVVEEQESSNQQQANIKTRKFDKDIVAAKTVLGVSPASQEKRYKDFKVKLDEERTRNNDFTSDLQTIEKEKRLLANAELNNFYIGEKLPRQNNEMAKKYPQGITEETTESGNSITITRIKITGEQSDVYERVFYAWGGTFFYKNGLNITQSLWDKESIE